MSPRLSDLEWSADALERLEELDELAGEFAAMSEAAIVDARRAPAAKWTEIERAAGQTLPTWARKQIDERARTDER